MLAEFELLMPAALEEALELLGDGSPHVSPVAGGTNMIVDLRAGRHCPAVLMDVSRLKELRGIRQEDGQVVIGSGTTLSQVLDNPLVADNGAVLKQSAAVFANPLVRNRATIGGNLADASPAADTAPPLLVLDAMVDLVSRKDRRCLPLEHFFVGVRKTELRPDELVAAVRWPIPPVGSAGAFYKIGLRKADAISVASVAVQVEPEGHRCRQARIALGAVAPRPIRVHSAEDILAGQPLTAALIAEAARLAAEAASPISDVRGSAAYRRRMVEILVRRLLAQAAGRAGCGA